MVSSRKSRKSDCVKLKSRTSASTQKLITACYGLTSTIAAPSSSPSSSSNEVCIITEESISISSSTTTVNHHENLKPILKAAQRLTRSARKICVSKKIKRRDSPAVISDDEKLINFENAKKIRFQSSPECIDITPRQEKIEGVVKMPYSPPIMMIEDIVTTSVNVSKRKKPNTKQDQDIEIVHIEDKTKDKTAELPPKTDAEILTFNELFRPKNIEEFYGNDSTVEEFKNWLVEQKSKLKRGFDKHPESSQTKKTAFDDDSDSDYEDDGEEDEPTPVVAFIHGPTASGKTSLVHCLAENLGFSVIEINASSSRSYKDFVAQHQMATQYKRISLQNKNCKPNDAECSKNDLRSFFSRPKTRRMSFIEEKPVEKTLKKSNELSLILLDDVDIIFQQDKNFWAGVRDLSQESKIPIILTSTENNPSALESLQIDVKTFDLRRLEVSQAMKYLKIKTASLDCVKPLNISKFKSYFDESNSEIDLRHIINQIQFFTKFEPCGSTNEDETKIYFTLKNDAKILDGLNDHVSNIDYDWSVKWDEIGRFSNRNQNLTFNRQLNALKSNLTENSLKFSLMESKLTLDYLPFLTLISRSESDQPKQDRRRSGRVKQSYLHKIGLDDRFSSLQSILKLKNYDFVYMKW